MEAATGIPNTKNILPRGCFKYQENFAFKTNCKHHEERTASNACFKVVCFNHFPVLKKKILSGNCKSLLVVVIVVDQERYRIHVDQAL